MRWINSWLVLGIVAGPAVHGADAPPVEVDPLLMNGPTDRRINLVILSEGYRAQEFDAFREEARRLAETILSEPPFDAYRSYFNVFSIAVPSNESGSDHPSRNEFRDTYFNSTYDSFGLRRLITIPPNEFSDDPANGVGRVDDLLIEWLPEYDAAMMLVNDPEFGGSGGGLAIASIESASAEIMFHELGHVFAALGDEYESPSAESFGGGIEDPNTTQERQREAIKWRDWIEDATPIPTPETDVFREQVGLFQGARYNRRTWWRPQLDCRMRTLNQPFCRICREALVLSFYQVISPIDSQFPEVAEVVVAVGEVAQFGVTVLEKDIEPLEVEWLVDGSVRVQGGPETFDLDTRDLPPGTYSVAARVRDPTLDVRNAADGLLESDAQWSLRIMDLREPPKLVGLRLFEDRRLEFQVLAGAGQEVVVESSTDLRTWSAVLTNQAPVGVMTIQTEPPNRGPLQFFRALVR